MQHWTHWYVFTVFQFGQLYTNYRTPLILQNLYLSKLSLSFHLLPSQHDRPGFSDFSISPDWLITLESCIFGYDIIHNSSINSTSHFFSVSSTFLTLPVYISGFSLRIAHRSPPISLRCHLRARSPFLVFTSFFTDHSCRSHMMNRVIQSGARPIDSYQREVIFQEVVRDDLMPSLSD